MVGKQVFPVSKNGKYFGMADAKQIADNPALELFDEAKAAVAIAKKAVAEAVKAEDEKTKTDEVAKGKGADPAAVRRGPKKAE